ncbi:Regulator of chromosome condensation [Physocladia obscura]|uniref:Regulator of chromosome condensation n=1 Tax=Physocladia obscura TaxID=109957 RepID=A0AAD5ST34_9FUNG|nr:Regulator of chromosome condensation [Physocladia obscura]
MVSRKGTIRERERESANEQETSSKRAKLSEATAPANPAPTHAYNQKVVFQKLTNPDTNPAGEVFIVGAGDCGQLGLGADVSSATKLKKLTYFEDKKIVSIAVGGLHNVVLSEDGKLFSWGCNDQMALGRSGEETEPAPVSGLEDIKIVQIACGDSISAALSEDGHVYAWGTFRNKNGIFGFRSDIDVQATPFRIPELSKITSIHAGADHLVAFTIDRKIYTWGCGESGQLGRFIMARKEKERSLTPTQLEFKPNKRQIATPSSLSHFPKKSDAGITYQSQFVGVSCTGNGTYLIHENGVIFALGLNNYGQLGVGDTDEHLIPVPLSPVVEYANKESGGAVDTVEIISISGSFHHTVALDKNGRVFTFGRNDDGQLGTGDNAESLSSPNMLPEPKNVIQVSANGAFTLAVTQDTEFNGNNLWLWGYGEMGQLANGGEDESIPTQIELKGRHVYLGRCGGQHTLLLLKPKE